MTLICNKCKKHMKCIKTGALIIYPPAQDVYAADIFACTCGNEIIDRIESSFFVEDLTRLTDPIVIPTGE